MSTANRTSVAVHFDPTANSQQADIIGPATSSKAGVMTAQQVADLASIVAGTVSSVGGTAPIVSSGGPNPVVSITPATTLTAGSMSAADKAKLDGIPPGGGGPPFTDTAFAVTDTVDPTKQVKFDVQGAAATTNTVATAQTVNRTQTLPDFDGDIPVVQTVSRQIFLNQPAADNGSGAGIQYRSDVASRAQLRTTQYGANTGVPGLSTFKSRGVLGALAPVVVADVIGGLTCVGVTDNNSIPLSGLLQFRVASVPAASGWIGTDFAIQNVSNLGPANGRRDVFKIDSEGVPWLRESRYPASPGNSAMGVAVTDGTGAVVVANTRITANTRIALTIQDGGTVPTNGVYVSARVPGTSFTIKSIAADIGVQVCYQLFEPIP